MSEENTSAEETTTTEETSAEEPKEEAPAEAAPKEEVVEEKAPEIKTDPATASDKSSEVSGSIGTGKQVFSGACKLCGARIASGAVDKDGKVHCPTCKGDF